MGKQCGGSLVIVLEENDTMNSDYLWQHIVKVRQLLDVKRGVSSIHILWIILPHLRGCWSH